LFPEHGVSIRSYKFQEERTAMYCPRCAAQNLDDAKFCRACGTNLLTVALALADQYHPARTDVDEEQAAQAEQSWLEKRTEGVSKIVKGAGLLLTSLLIGVAMGLFSNAPDWMIIWIAMVGWMAVWGVISLTSGISDVLASRLMARQLNQKATTASALQSSAIEEQKMLPDVPATNRLSAPPSVTERTTELLPNQPPASNRAR
jgi:ribosomal protein L40E